MTRYDVVTLGETMLKFTPPDLQRFEQTVSFKVEAGGTESNLAVGLARLGLKVAWLTRLTENQLGRLIERSIAGHGVDTSWVIWTDQDRVGLYFVEEGKMPRGSQVIYDRKNSAISQISPAELPVELFRPEGARLLHLTGITPALGPKAAATTRRALELAQESGWQISFDLNYRSKLWSGEAALEGCTPFMEAADILLAPLGDVRILYDLDPEIRPEEALDMLTDYYPRSTIVMTLGADGALGVEPGGKVIHQPAFPAEEVGRLGGGDAFAAGFLFAYLRAAGETGWLAQALRWGVAMAALKYSIPGDLPFITQAEVEALVKQGPARKKLVR